MNFYPLRFPAVFQKTFPKLLFHKKTNKKEIYLTFDDGPTPIITEWVLSELEKYNAKATFFCLGKNIEKRPEIFKSIIDSGHQIANHTYQHVKGWKTDVKTYLKEALTTEKIINKYTSSKKIFRPPYGRITKKQIKVLQKNGFKIVMWTSISGDFSQTLKPKKVIKQLTKQTQSGDILVFHDSRKAAENLKAILPALLFNLQQKGFTFKSI